MSLQHCGKYKYTTTKCMYDKWESNQFSKYICGIILYNECSRNIKHRNGNAIFLERIHLLVLSSVFISIISVFIY